MDILREVCWRACNGTLSKWHSFKPSKHTKEIVGDRTHSINLDLKVWKSIYLTQNKYYISLIRLTCKVQAADVFEQMSTIDGIHFRTEAHFPQAELLMHIMQGVSHNINSINNKLHLPFLLKVRVFSYPFLICKTQTVVHQVCYIQSDYAIIMTQMDKAWSQTIKIHLLRSSHKIRYLYPCRKKQTQIQVVPLKRVSWILFCKFWLDSVQTQNEQKLFNGGCGISPKYIQENILLLREYY